MRRAALLTVSLVVAMSVALVAQHEANRCGIEAQYPVRDHESVDAGPR